jgi:hypothetical protein
VKLQKLPAKIAEAAKIADLAQEACQGARSVPRAAGNLA